MLSTDNRTCINSLQLTRTRSRRSRNSGKSGGRSGGRSSSGGRGGRRKGGLYRGREKILS